MLRKGIWTLAIVVAAAQGAEPQVISVCEALTHPELYDHKLVAIRGIEVAGMEGGWLKGQTFDKAFVTIGSRGRWNPSKGAEIIAQANGRRTQEERLQQS